MRDGRTARGPRADRAGVPVAGGAVGGVTLSDYAWWKYHYGDPDGGAGGLGNRSVPEPALAACRLSS